jgi:signal transduction histidine kinase
VIFSVRDAIELSLTLIQDMLNVKSIAIVREYQDDFAVYGFPNELSQVVLNIIDNACKVCALRNVHGPRIRICLTRERENVLVAIHDNGGGLDTEAVDHVFEKFHTRTGGAGLGLYISRMIIEQHFDGSITARNDHEGAVFEIAIPVVQS